MAARRSKRAYWLLAAFGLTHLGCEATACANGQVTTSSRASTGQVRVAILADDLGGASRALAARLGVVLREGGFVVREITCDELTTESGLSPDAADVLVLPNSPVFPTAAKDNLLRFLKRGGHLVLMGGHAFRRSVYKVNGQWLSQAQLEATFATVPAEQVFFDFQGDLSAWERSSYKPSRPTTLSSDGGKLGRCMRMDIKSLDDGWDTHAGYLPAHFDETTDALCFWAKATAHTPEMAVELDEEDGSRWIANVAMTDEWTRYALTAGRFQFWRDGSPKDRGGKGDRLSLARARRVSFGLAFGITSQPQGDHTLWIDEVGSARLGLPGDVDFSQTVDLGVFSDYEVYQPGQIARVVTAPGQELLKTSLSIAGPFEGTSAIGFALPARSTFVPLLSMLDDRGRTTGWAGSLLIHYGGEFAGSNWLLFGLTTQPFYDTTTFGDVLVKLLRIITRGDLAKVAKAQDTRSRADRLPLTSPPPEGFLRRSDDGKHILYPDDRRFFMVGCNYLGSLDRKCYIGGDLFDVHRMEADFRMARRAGINAMRFWLNGLEKDPAKVRCVKELARRYGIYLLLHIGPRSSKGGEIVAGVRQAARAFKDEPMVIGYDLINEPYLGTVGAITIGGRKMPILELQPYETFAGEFGKEWVDNYVRARPEWPRMHAWVGEHDARNLYAAYSLWNRYQAQFKIGSFSTFPGLTGRLPMTGKWRRFMQAVDETFARWIKIQVEAIRAEDQRCLITVGYNSVLSCLPANRQLDYVSQHVYERPTSLEHVRENVTTLDRLARVWPDQPITFGEFGYSNGIRTQSGYLDVHTSSVGEMIHYLYALARGYDGCMKWSLTDWPLAVIRYNAPWIQGQDKQVYESRFGLYSCDGTPGNRPKPIAHALRFLRQTIDAIGPGGRIEIKPGNTSIGAAYVYRADGALFVGDVAYASPELTFRSKRPTNVMLAWGDAALRMMSTCDVKVRISPAAFVPSIGAGRVPSISGQHGATAMTENGLSIELLAGETVELRPQATR